MKKTTKKKYGRDIITPASAKENIESLERDIRFLKSNIFYCEKGIKAHKQEIAKYRKWIRIYKTYLPKHELHTRRSKNIQ